MPRYRRGTTPAAVRGAACTATCASAPDCRPCPRARGWCCCCTSWRRASRPTPAASPSAACPTASWRCAAAWRRREQAAPPATQPPDARAAALAGARAERRCCSSPTPRRRRSPALVDSPRPITLVVPDGTWSQAVRARRRIPGLADIPCAALPPGLVSTYRLRHDPRAGRVSTLEAIAHALGVLEGPAHRRGAAARAPPRGRAHALTKGRPARAGGGRHPCAAPR